MKKIILLSILAILSVKAHEFHHECEHGHMDYSNITPPDFFETFEEKYGGRRLQQQTSKPMRITYDFSELDNPANGSGMTPIKKQFILNIVETTKLYLSKLIKVYPRTTPIKMENKDICYDMKVPQKMKDIGVIDSDLHIFVTFINNSTTNALANAIHCHLDPNPVVGRIQFNIAKIRINESIPQYFQDNFSVALHETLHILGINGANVKYWLDPDTGLPYGVDNASKVLVKEKRWGMEGVSKLFSRNILKLTKKYFGCDSIDGLYLENQGAPGTMGAHFEADLLNNEIMNASIVKEAFSISEFTAAILLDTGYYADINKNILMPMKWGKNQGCDFYNNVCNSTQSNYFEFAKQTGEGCDFHSRAISLNYKTSTSQCGVMINYENTFCTDSVSWRPAEKLRQNSGVGSKCYRSSAVSTAMEQDWPMSGNCFKTQCSDDFQTIKVFIWGDEFVTCTKPDQLIDFKEVTKTTKGIMYCPHDFEYFCTFPSVCPNKCSSNGVCINGYCICRDGQAGEDCSIQCPLTYAWDGLKCVPSCEKGFFRNFNNVCKTTCPFKQYKDETTGTCQFCHNDCSTCSGPNSNQCNSCNTGLTLSGIGNYCFEGKCDESCLTCTGTKANQCFSCPDGKILDSNNSCRPCELGTYFLNGKCIPCSPNCTSCVSQDKCLSCAEDYSFQADKFQCILICDSSCLTCTGARSNQCASCPDGKILDSNNSCRSCESGTYFQNGKCIPCSSNCTSCESQDKCLSCAEGYSFQADKFQCILICDSSCLTCTGTRSNQCASCPDGKILDSNNSCRSCQLGTYFLNGKCIPCSPNCTSCESQDKCLTCAEGYTFQADTFQCLSQNLQCHMFCKTCTKSNDQKACSSCKSDMFLSDGQCFACLKDCATCYGKANNCTSCLSGYELKNGVCSLKNVQCHQSCRTCSAPPQDNKTNCKSCLDGKYLSGDSCLPCSASCKACGIGSFICTQCYEGYTLKGAQCLRDTSGLKNLRA